MPPEEEATPDRSPRRVIGRILSLGFPLPGTHVDNYNFLSAPSFFDYDAIVVEPGSLSQLIERVIAGDADEATFAGSPVRVTPVSPGDVALGSVLARRRDETARLLRNGGAVICFAQPPISHVVGDLGEIDDYYWLPARDRRFSELFAPSDGTQAHVVDYQHPLAAFVAGQLANISYHARAVDELVSPRQVFVRSQGGAGIGFEVPSSCGRIIVLPALRSAPAGDARYQISDALQAGIRRALGVEAEGRPPSWLSSHPLPGLSDREKGLESAQQAVAAARLEAEAAQASHDELVRYQRLLWQEGSVGLTPIVLDALRLIGCEVYASDPNELELRIGQTPVLIEIEASEYPVDMAPHHRLRQRVERAIEQRRVAPRAVLLVNGQRLLDPRERPGAVTEPLRLAAETMRYCIAPTSTLYAAVAASLAGDSDAVAAYLARIIATDGLLA